MLTSQMHAERRTSHRGRSQRSRSAVRVRQGSPCVIAALGQQPGPPRLTSRLRATASSRVRSRSCCRGRPRLVAAVISAAVRCARSLPGCGRWSPRPTSGTSMPRAPSTGCSDSASTRRPRRHEQRPEERGDGANCREDPLRSIGPAGRQPTRCEHEHHQDELRDDPAAAAIVSRGR